MENLSNLDSLIKTLLEADKSSISKILSKTSINQSELDKYASWETTSYTRNCIFRNNQFELILICWDVDAQTKIHNHGGQECWVYQLLGQLTENKFEEVNGKLALVDSQLLNPNDITYMKDDLGYHQLQNKSNSRCYTLHVYALPIDECSVFNESLGQFETTLMTYHTRAEEKDVAKIQI